MLWYAIRRHGIDGLRRRADAARELAAYLHARLDAMGWDTYHNPLGFTVVLRAPSPAVTAKWVLATSGEWSHIITVPGVSRESIDAFLADLEASRAGTPTAVAASGNGYGAVRQLRPPTPEPTAYRPPGERDQPARTAVTVELGHIGAPPLPRPPEVRNRLFYLPSAEAIIMPEMRQAGGWRCAVVAARTPWRLTHRPGHFDLSDDQIAALSSTITLDPDTDPEGYAMVWVARIRQYDPCGMLPKLARRLNDDLRIPGSLTADFVPAAVDWPRRGAHPIMMRALKLQIDRLIVAGFLVRDDLAGTNGGLGAYTLTLPEPVLAGALTADGAQAGPTQ